MMVRFSAAVRVIFLLFSVLLPVSVYAQEAKVYYKDGTHLESGDFHLRFNVMLQPRYQFSDLDSEARRNNGFEAAENTSSFDLHRARLIFSGGALDDAVSYNLEYETQSEDGGSDLRDAWIQWNADPAKIRFGQFKKPYGREERISAARLFFTDRTIVSDVFTDTSSESRAQGAMVIVSAADGVNLNLSLNNGESTGEGANLGGVDTGMQGVLGFDYSSYAFGDRDTSGDFREDTSSFGWTLGLSFAYGEGTRDVEGDFDKFDANADFGLRFSGFEFRTEFFHTDFGLDDTTIGGEDSLQDQGFTAAALYNINQKWGLGVRYASLDPDDAITSANRLDGIDETSLALNYYWWKHHLKATLNYTLQETDVQNGEKLEDHRWMLQMSSYF